jgi:hypothetical protein
MPPHEVRATVRMIAEQTARVKLHQLNPRLDDAALDRYATEHWEEHVDTALDVLACLAASDEQVEMN